MDVYYKFKSAKDYDSILIDVQFISVPNLKERIFESNNLGRGIDFYLMVSNAQSNESWFSKYIKLSVERGWSFCLGYLITLLKVVRVFTRDIRAQ
ncbi:hypothetical protein KSP39_PZI014618 [Platanthera zijinensis]|uniref:DWNN domain-containing protein n=1 Tax=Platanthera zijinensis TaxID=2320716 RepID=A0AAP0B9R9_9ASPA